jgi:hypothetical protein
LRNYNNHNDMHPTTTSDVITNFGRDSFYLHCLVYRNMVGLIARFGAPLTGFNSQAVIILLLTVPRRRSSVFLRFISSVVSYCFGDTSACVPCWFLVYGKYLPPLPLVFISLIYTTRTLPPVSCTLPLCPLTLWA